MFALAFRNITRSRLRTALTLTAIACGVAAIIVSGGFVEDVFVQLRESTIRSRLGHAQVYRAGYLEFGDREPGRYLIAKPDPLVDIVRALPHVEAVTSRVNFSGLANNGRADLPVIGEGIEPERESRFASAMTFVAGRQLGGGDAFDVIVGEGVANALDLKPGSPINLTLSTTAGALNSLEFRVVGIFRTFSKEYDDRAIRISKAAAQELLNSPAIHSVVVMLDETRNTDAAVAAIRLALGNQGYEVKPWHELADFYSKTVALYRRQFGALQLIILVMLVLSVANTVNMVVHERTGEFGTLLALGSRRRQVFRLVLLENALLGVVGAAVGMALGIALAVILSTIGIAMPPPPGSNSGYTASIRLVPWVIGAAAVTGAVAAALAAILPGWRAARMPVVEALRYNV